MSQFGISSTQDKEKEIMRLGLILLLLLPMLSAESSAFSSSFLMQLRELEHCSNPSEVNRILSTTTFISKLSSSRRAEAFSSRICLRTNFSAFSTSLLANLIRELAPSVATVFVAECVSHLFQSTSNQQAIDLKYAVDKHLPLYRFVLHSIRSRHPLVAENILRHFETQVPAQRSPKPVQLLSDIDDTIFSCLFDRRYRIHTGTKFVMDMSTLLMRLVAYPGVYQFHQEFRALAADIVRPLVLLTGRPEFIFRPITNFHLEHVLGIQNSTLLMGTFKSIVGGKANGERAPFFNLLGGGNIIKEKQKVFLQYQRLFKEFEYVFIGDSGQSDIDFAQKLLNSSAISMAGILDISRNASSEESYPGNRITTRDAECERSNIRLFATYIGAAIQAHETSYLTLAAVKRIAIAAGNDFCRKHFFSRKQRNKAKEEVLYEMTLLNRLFPREEYHEIRQSITC